ncbi:hypothetical protein ABEO76_21795 [Bacillus anthracis]|uniref:hypothetical protein n=1 Tax=Bacillus anthracis TaxID=1392 RepID=UPI003D20B09A
MSIYTTMNLLEGNERILTYYKEAESIWRSIWKHAESETADGLARVIGNSQYKFENNCGGLSLGQEIMAQVGFAMLYSENPSSEDKRKSRMLLEAFRNSGSSTEVIARAEESAEIFLMV